VKRFAAFFAAPLPFIELYVEGLDAAPGAGAGIESRPATVAEVLSDGSVADQYGVLVSL
jgi:hypothetical protein